MVNADAPVSSPVAPQPSTDDPQERSTPATQGQHRPDPCKGFTTIPNEVICAIPTIGNMAFTVYVALSNHAWGTKTECNPSLIRMAEMLGVDKTTICRNLKVLEAAGFIVRARVAGGRCKRTTYHLRLPGNSGTSATVSGTETVAQAQGNSGASAPETVAPAPHEEYKEEYKEEADARATPPPASTKAPDPDDPADVEEVLLSWEWDGDRLRTVLRESGFRLDGVLGQLRKGRPIWELNDNRVVKRDDGAFLELLKAVERARGSLVTRSSKRQATRQRLSVAA